jgi:glycosyltransferase involved in cell wall biosynthesis
MKKRIGVLMYQTSTSKGQELVAQRMVKDFNAIGQEAFLITSIFHDGNEVVQAESLRENKGYAYAEDSELGIPIIRVDSYLVKWPHRRICFKDFVDVLGRIVEEFGLNVLITHSTLWNGPEDVGKFVSWRRYMRDLEGYKDTIVYCHMSHFQDPSPKRYSLLERTFRMAWNRFSLSQILKIADLILVVTPLEKAAKVKMGADPKKCLLFPSGVDEELFLRYATTDTGDFFRERGIPSKMNIVSFLGSIEERKNPDGVLKVAELLKDRHDIHFVIAGRGESNFAKRVKEEAGKLRNVTYLGQVNEKEKILLIKSSKANILLSQLEALGLTQLEFMYGGVPVITSAAGGQSWLIQDGKEGIHTNGPNDFEGAAKAITNLVENNELWARLSENAKAKARSMSCSRMIRRLDDALTEEMFRENGLIQLPVETRKTIENPQKVIKTWTSGKWGVVATEKRLFVREGRFSRKVTEVPYSKISYFEHTRRYSWKPLVLGFLPALIGVLEPAWRTLLQSSFVSAMEGGLMSIALSIPIVAPQTLLFLLCLASVIAGVGVFVFKSRTGFNLCVEGMKPIYIPHTLGEVVTFLRDKQNDQDVNLELTTRSYDLREEIG